MLALSIASFLVLSLPTALPTREIHSQARLFTPPAGKSLKFQVRPRNKSGVNHTYKLSPLIHFDKTHIYIPEDPKCANCVSQILPEARVYGNDTRTLFLRHIVRDCNPAFCNLISNKVVSNMNVLLFICDLWAIQPPPWSHLLQGKASTVTTQVQLPTAIPCRHTSKVARS